MGLLIGFVLGALTTWICMKMIQWEKESHKDDVKEDIIEDPKEDVKD
jgi:hypothetical protein